MKLTLASCALLLAAGATPAGAQQPPPVPSPGSWRFDPSLYVLGSVDHATDLPFGSPFVENEEPSPAANLGFGLDFSREQTPGWIRGSLFTLARSPYASERGFFGAFWIEAAHPFGARGRVTFTEAGKAQRRPQQDLSDYWRNELTLRADWSGSSGRGLEVGIADHRRGLPDLQPLRFSQQSLALAGFVPLGSSGRARVAAEVQRYSAPTADGGRAVFEGELARFTRAGIASLRLAWVEPFGDRRRPHPEEHEPDEPYESYDYGDAERTELFERLVSSEADVAEMGGWFSLDPLESESDAWDFGRRKLVAAGFLSHRLGSRTTASLFFRLQHKHGPNLLVPAEADTAGPFTDDRGTARISIEYRLRPRVSVRSESSYDRNWSSRPDLDFHRFLLALGVQIHF